MLPEDTRERMRRSYHLEKKSLRQIAREEHCSRETVKKVVFDLPQKSYQLTQPKPTFVFGQPFQARVEALLTQNDQLPRKQRYSSRKIFETLRAEGYEGFESHFCTPGAGWEKGQVEHGVGFSRRNFIVPIPEAASEHFLFGLAEAEVFQQEANRVERRIVKEAHYAKSGTRHAL